MKNFILYSSLVISVILAISVHYSPILKDEPIQEIPPEPLGPTLVINKTKEGIIDYIKEYSDIYNVDQELALEIARCESGYDYEVQNSSSSAQGVYQFIDSTWEYTMNMMDKPTTTPKTDVPISVEAGVFLFSKEGDRHWEESEHCWSKIK